MSEWLSDGVLLVGDDAEGTVAAIAIDLPVEPGTVTVVSLLNSARDWWWLTDAVGSAAPPGAAVRLAVSNAGLPQGDAPPPAQQLAERLRTDVIAPDGPVLLTPGGTAFVTRPAGAAASGDEPHAADAAGQWLRFSPDGSVEPAGPRYPTPPWAAAVTRLAADPVAGMTLVEVPAGLWVLAEAGGVAPAPADLPFCVPVDPELCTIIVGSAGSDRPDPAVVAEALAGLPPMVRSRLLVAAYGSGARAAAAVAGELARRWGQPVDLANGMPMIGSDGDRHTLATDEDGTPLWWPITQRMRCDPSGPPVPVDPADPLTDLPVVAKRVWSLREPWLVESTHFGLWVRHRDAPVDARQLDHIPSDPRWLTVVAGVPGQPSDGIRPVLAGLLARLPEQARARVRMVSPDLLSRLTSLERTP